MSNDLKIPEPDMLFPSGNRAYSEAKFLAFVCDVRQHIVEIHEAHIATLERLAKGLTDATQGGKP